MPAAVNLDALISREDFEVLTEGEDAPVQNTIRVSDLEGTAFFFPSLRKPDFQRETSEWDPKRVAGLIQTFIEDELIPAVILWKHRDLIFVIDGSHRLSALIAWVQDDYGDGARSRELFGPALPEEQIVAADRARKLVHKAIGSYQDHKKAVSASAEFGPDIVSRARRLGTLALTVQWVRGNAAKAEDSFGRINQQAAIITAQELQLIKSRAKPNTIAARAVIRKGKGHKYWSSFSEQTQGKTEEIATEVHNLMFDPAIHYPIKSLDLPAGGPVYSATALRMVYDFMDLAAGVPSEEDDTTGQRTMDYLTRARRVMRMVLSNHPSSLGLHPAVYFYSWTGKQQPVLFLVIASLIIDRERDKKLMEFTKVRGRFEQFLMDNRSLTAQVVRKFGTKASGTANIRGFYEDVLALLAGGRTSSDVVTALTARPAYSYLQPTESPYSGSATPAKLSTQARAGVVLKQLLETAPRCGICGGVVPFQAISVDHIVRREDGGPAIADNAQVTHPYCNTGFKESEASRARKGTGS